ncbi:N-acetylmuramoyl-L-alanine amidase [Cloacibacillus evryensis]|uniref:N-acetylmuramoyl-L-alanine amidase n=1 Tax=Cloacibacillus evryensis TaxID=508460 RepID=UPI0004BCB526|nr:N-acetylmuramoyl-L-alanine amidase [Cloacibacillus evryensis]
MDNKTFFALAQQRPQLNAFAALCQCHHETREAGKPWSSELCWAANNCAGIKKGSGWQGAIYNKVSWEQSADGDKYNAESAFRKYDSIADFLADYEAKIAKMYPLCDERRDNFWGVFDGLLTGPYKWATDKEYFRRLAETAVRLAPEIFGAEAAELKLKTALLYAIEKGYLSDANAAIAIDVLGIYAANDGAKNRPKAPEIENAAALSANAAGKPKTICIDAGHGGKDPGACAGGVPEKDIALSVAKLIGGKLAGHTVVYTRTADNYVALPERTDYANRSKADILVSIHCNSATSEKANGVEVYTHTSQSDRSVAAASAIYKKLLAASGMAGRGIKAANYHVLRETKKPAVLVELGFISNAADREKLTSAAWQEKAAAAIAAGIKEYIERG